MAPFSAKDIEEFTTISEIADVLPIQSYKKLESDSSIDNNGLKFFIKKNISLGDNVGRLSIDSDFDYAIFNSSESMFYISFILNSKFGYNSIGKTNQRTQIATVSLGRIKDTIIPINNYMDDCCYLEKILSFATRYYLSLDENDETRESFPFLFFLSYLYRVKSYMILEMFQPEVFRLHHFSMLNSWRKEKYLMGNEIPSLALLNNLLKTMFSSTSTLKTDMHKIRVLATTQDFSPIL